MENLLEVPKMCNFARKWYQKCDKYHIFGTSTINSLSRKTVKIKRIIFRF